MTYAGFFKRWVAFILDMLFIGFVTFFIMFFLGFIVGGAMGDTSSVETFSKMGFWADIVFVWLYYAGLESSERQATFGKSILGIYVTDGNGGRISFAQATIRHFSKYISSIFFIGFIMIAFTARKQGLHDLIADTLVVNR